MDTVVVILAKSGSLVAEVRDLDGAVEARAEVTDALDDAAAYWAAFESVWRGVGQPTAGAVIVGGEPLTVVFDAHWQVIGSIGVATDADTGPDAGWLAKQLPNGIDDWTVAVGASPSAESAIAKLSWLHRCAPDHWERLAHVLSLPDWLTMRLGGAPATDPLLAATTGYWSAFDHEYRWQLLAIVDRDRDWTGVVPPVHVDRAEPLGWWQGSPVLVATVAGSTEELHARWRASRRR